MIQFALEGQMGRIQLDRPKQINALNTSLLTALDEVREMAVEEDAIGFLALDSTSPRGFCSGGDLKEVYHEALVRGEDSLPYFHNEFTIEKKFLTFPKPLVAYWRGVTMGGGIGLSIGSDIVIVDDSAKVAMPETRLGIIPDVGMAYYFSKMPRPLSMHLQMTGRIFTGADAKRFRWADVYVRKEDYEKIFRTLGALRLKGTTKEEQVREILEALAPFQREPEETDLMRDLPLIEKYFRGNPMEIVQNLKAGDDDFAKKYLEELKGKCPTSLAILWERYEAAKNWTRPQTFDMDLLAIDYGNKKGNLKEGIRTTLIEKNDLPKWNPPTLEEVDFQEVRRNVLNI